MPNPRHEPLVPFFCVAVLGCLSACTLGQGRMVIVGRTPDLQERAERTLRVPLEVAGVEAISLAAEHGSIETVAVDTGFEVVAELEIWAKTQADAVHALAGFEVVCERAAQDRLAVRLAGEPLVYEDLTSTAQIWPRARVIARVPRGSRIAASSGSGDLRVQGPLGAIELASGHGRIHVTDVEGVDARTSSGDIEARRITGPVRLVSAYGGIDVGESRAEAVTLDTGSGNVRLRQVAATKVVATSRYGSIDARQVDGDLELTTSSGSIAVEGAGKGRHELKTGYGRVSVRGGAGELVARSKSGNVEVDGFTGSVQLASGYGAVEANGVFTALHANSDSGRVQVSAGEGSRAGVPWSLSSGYGNVELGLPADFGCELRAKTAYGRIHSDLAVTLEPGSVDRGSLRGVIGAGGGRVDLVSSSGNISVRKQ